MKAQTRPSAGAIDGLLHPAYWLVSGLDWNGDRPIAEAAVAAAPGTIPRNALSPDAFQVLGRANLYAARHGRRVILFSELTRILAQAGTSWPQLDVDWQSAVRQLHNGSFPAMYLTISERIYLHICDASDQGLMITGGESRMPTTSVSWLEAQLPDTLTATGPRTCRSSSTGGASASRADRAQRAHWSVSRSSAIASTRA
jgi:hypothetical protein